MAQSEPHASPSTSLLARKGSARPAMRPQDLGLATIGQATGQTGDQSLDDLGWNDLGEMVPPVLVERQSLKVEIERSRARLPVSPATLAQIDSKRSSRTKTTKVAFTVRIAAEQHMRLRRAAAIAESSSQYIVTQALDAFLHSLSEVDAHVAQLLPSKSNR